MSSQVGLDYCVSNRMDPAKIWDAGIDDFP